MIKDLVVIGSGGLGIVDLIADINAEKPTFNLIGFLEKDSTKHGTEVLGVPVLGGDDLLLKECKHCSVINNVMANPRLHEVITKMLIEKYGITDFPNLVHPNVERRHSTMGVGNIIYAHSKLSQLVSIGDFNISYSTQIGHETRIGSYNLMARTTFGSRCKIGNYNLFGNMSVVTNSCRVGDDNVIGVCAVVMQHVKNEHRLLGYPAIEEDEFVRRYLVKKSK